MQAFEQNNDLIFEKKISIRFARKIFLFINLLTRLRHLENELTKPIPKKSQLQRAGSQVASTGDLARSTNGFELHKQSKQAHSTPSLHDFGYKTMQTFNSMRGAGASFSSAPRTRFFQSQNYEYYLQACHNFII